MNKHYKISLVFRSYDVLYEYRKKNEKTFWDEVREDLNHIHSDWKVDVELFGLTRAEVTLETDISISAEAVKKYIGSFLEDARECIVVLSEVTEDETPGNKEKVTSEVADGGKTETKTNTDNIAPAPRDDSEKSVGETVDNVVDSQREKFGLSSLPENKTDDKPLGIFDEAKRLESFKSAMLEIVFGQRHAIDEFAEAVFESDGFARNDEERKGPVASLLFVGPSGVGKTHLAKKAGKYLGRETKVLDMSEYSDNIAYNRLNGEGGFPSPLINFIKAYPNGVVVFDEIEKAHITTVHLLLQILDEGRLKENVSFKDAIIILTTNAGASLYDDPTVYDLSGVSKQVILDALGTDRNPYTGGQIFPECITTRFASGHVVLFNHLEPYALMEIVAKEIEKQTELFRKTYNIKINCDVEKLSALVLYCCGGTADARTLKGAARQIIVRELQEIIMQMYKSNGENISQLQNINITMDIESGDEEVRSLFDNEGKSSVAVLADRMVISGLEGLTPSGVSFEFFDNVKEFRERSRSPIDFVIIDPFCNMGEMDRIPNDIEDIRSEGMEAFRFMKKYFPEIPVYALDARCKGVGAYGKLVSGGCRGVVETDMDKVEDCLNALSLSAVVNNNSFRISRSGKMLTYNSSQYTLNDSEAEIMFTRLEMKIAARASDKSMMVKESANGVKFDDIVGCKKAKDVLKEFCEIAKDPKKAAAKGKKIPKGVLLYGPPGTGKTMLAKAMANEAGIPFFQTTATTFFNMYVGQTEQNIRDLFAKARRYAPSVIFIDEVDSLAKKRSGMSSTSHNEDALTAFLAEMDGFVTDEKRPVFIISATNYDISPSSDRSLDPAFVRRFNERIYVDLPDIDERQELLEKELTVAGINFGEKSAQLIKNVAERSAGLSNADIHTVVESFLKKCGFGTPDINVLMDALDEFRFGEVNKIEEDRLRQTACHESGHALINRLLGYTPSFLTIVSRGYYGGFMEHSRDELKDERTFNRIMNKVCCALAGRAAEIVVYGADEGLNAGASQDIKTAREYIKYALDDYAMGNTLYISDVKDYKDEAEALMKEQFDRAVKLISDNRSVLDSLTDLLVSEKNLDKVRLEEFFTSKCV